VCGAAGNASLIAFTEAVGGLSPDFGVRVLGVNPGSTATERLLARPVEGDGPDAAELAEAYPTLRVAPPSAIADMVVFLTSDRARCVSGVVLDTDYGQLRRTIPR
jgi:NAD(P)-dependent dehydrogenase (short-subunit alcohol dehydrogenase family)